MRGIKLRGAFLPKNHNYLLFDTTEVTLYQIMGNDRSGGMCWCLG